MRITAGIIGVAGAAASLFVGVLFMIGATFSIVIESPAGVTPRPALTTMFRDGGLLIVVSAITLAFSVTLLCARIRRASSIILIAAGLAGVAAEGWTAAALLLAGTCGLLADRPRQLRMAVC